MAVVVVTYNSADLLPDFFATLNDALKGVSATVVVSDNASHDSTIDVARACMPEGIIVESPTNRGYAAAINAGVRAAPDGSAVLVLNDDMRLGQGSVQRLVDSLERDDVGICVPRLVDGDGRLLKSLRREPTVGRALGEALLGGNRSGRSPRFGEVIQEDAAYDLQTRTAWASGCAWLISPECWADVGEWDESLFLYAEDIDYALRARDAGYSTVLVPTADGVHLVGPSRSNPDLWAMSVWNRYRVFRRRNGPIRSSAFWLALLVGESLRCLASRITLRSTTDSDQNPGRTIHCAGAAALVSASRRPEQVR